MLRLRLAAAAEAADDRRAFAALTERRAAAVRVRAGCALTLAQSADARVARREGALKRLREEAEGALDTLEAENEAQAAQLEAERRRERATPHRKRAEVLEVELADAKAEL